MDDISEYLKSSTLNGSDFSSAPQFISLSSSSAIPVTLNLPELLASSQSVIPVSASPSSSFFTLSGGGFAHPTTVNLILPQPQSQMPRTRQSAPAWTPAQTPVPLDVSPTSDGYPEMPVLNEAQDDDLSMSEPDGEGEGTSTGDKRNARDKGKQKPGSLSAHAVYARMNRERKKKYVADMEKYRTTMKKKTTEGQRELEHIRKESQMLADEISGLRDELMGNQPLMSLLSMGTSKKN